MRRWCSFFLCYFAYAGLYICRNNLSILSPHFTEQGIATAAQIGLMTGLFSLFYAAGKLFCGSLGDRLNPKTVAALGTCVAGGANIAIALLLRENAPFALILLFWVLNSVGQSLVWGPVLRLVDLNTPERGKAFATAMLPTSLCLGGVAGILIASATARHTLARGFFVPGCITLFAGALLFFCFPGDTGTANAAAAKNGVFHALKLREVRRMIFPVAAQGVIRENVLNWAALYLVAQYGLELRNLPFFVLLIPLVSLAGRLCYPFFYRVCGRDHTRLSRLCFFGCLVLSLLLIPGSFGSGISVAALVLIAMLGNVMNTAFLSFFPVSLAETGLVSSVASLMDVIAYAALGLSSSFFGVLIHRFDLNGYRMMFALFALFALLGCLFLPNSRRKADRRA